MTRGTINVHTAIDFPPHAMPPTPVSKWKQRMHLTDKLMPRTARGSPCQGQTSAPRFSLVMLRASPAHAASGLETSGLA